MTFCYCTLTTLKKEVEEWLGFLIAGKEELEIAFQKWDQSAECHQWYVTLSSVFKKHRELLRADLHLKTWKKITAHLLLVGVHYTDVIFSC